MNLENRLHDPTGKIQASLKSRCSKKIGMALAVLASHPSNGGNPLLFSLATGRQHILLSDGDYTPLGKGFKTAATDGKSFYWYADFLDNLDTLQTLTVLKHETYHNLLLHPKHMHAVEYPMALNIAADFLVNAMIERDWSAREQNSNTKRSLWYEPLGEPITLEELKELFFKNKEETIENVKDRVNKIKEGDYDKPKEGDCDKPKESIEDCKDAKVGHTLVDHTLLGRSAMDIYKEIKEWYSSLDEELKELLGDFLTDHHVPGNPDEKGAIDDLLRSVGFARSMRGEIPAEVEALLQELNDPILDLSEFLDQSIKKTIKDGGNRACYTRFKRRFVGEHIYFPRYMRPIPQVLVLLDTSGSMTEKDISVGTSELQQFVGKADIFIVPTDAEPHWNHVSKVTSQSDFQKVELVGRGGTVFHDFFRDYRVKLRKYGHFDSIIVITDGMIDVIPAHLEPPCDVGWVMTSPSDFQQYFGKPIYLQRPE